MEWKKIFSSKYTFHYVLWILLTLSLALDARALLIAGIGTFSFYVFAKTIVMASIVYLNILWLYPAYFKQKRFLAYGIFILFMAVVAGYANMRLEEYVTPGYFFTSNSEHFLFFISQLLMALRYILFSFLLKITVDYYLQKEEIKKIELEKATAELNFLKAQVNPHFLFNTLNNLYGLILENSDKSGEAVLKLADIMKYTIAEGKEDKVSLQKEINLLYNYVELERLRKPNAEISFTTSGSTSKFSITPLLILPLVENAFKYGLNSVNKNGFVRIDITTDENRFKIIIENNIPPIENKDAMHSLGIGIENVNRRLELLYPGKYKFNMMDTTASFLVNLQLQLS